tara:strand:+ start:1071 stop:1265 length:195 start_codon:yes stop_codon:yes gene_type:complete
MIFESLPFCYFCEKFYSVAVISLPINTMKTAGVKIPINGTNIEGNQLAASSEDIEEFKFCCYFK